MSGFPSASIPISPDLPGMAGRKREAPRLPRFKLNGMATCVASTTSDRRASGSPAPLRLRSGQRAQSPEVEMVDAVEGVAASSSMGWRPVLGIGLTEDARREWMWRHVRVVLGLEVTGVVAICWGQAALPTGVTAFVRVPRDESFIAGPSRLREALVRAREVDVMPVDPAEVRLQVDIFAWVDWLLSRAEEYNSATVDADGRFPREESLLFRAGLTEQPAADLLVSALREAVKVAARSGGIAVRRTSPWPPGKRFAVCLTHDIDNAVRQSAAGALRKLAAAGVALSKRQRRTAGRRVSDAVGLLRGNAASPYWLMDPMAAREAARGYRSTFFVLPHTRRTVSEGSHRARRYDVRHRDVQQLLRRLSVGGWELGLHTSYDAHEDSGGVAREWKYLRATVPAGVEIAGARSHYLRLWMPYTLRQEEEAGIPYDASMGWSTGWGFRSGSAMPYRPFDLTNGRELTLWELELHLMDVSVPSDDYLLFLNILLDRVRDVGGCASVLLHPSPYSDLTTKQYLTLYDRVLDQIARYEDAWVSTPSTVVRHMTDYVRSQSTVD